MAGVLVVAANDGSPEPRGRTWTAADYAARDAALARLGVALGKRRAN